MNRRDIEERVRRVSWPAPSKELRDRVLSSAVASAPRITWSDRMYFSRGWRLAAVATVLAVAALEQISGPARTAGFTASTKAMADAKAIDDAGRQVGLPPEVMAALTHRAFARTPQSQTDRAAALLDAFDTQGTGGDR